MGTVSFIGKHTCEESFPGSPAFAKYLADRLEDMHASLELTRVFCFSLRECCTSPPPIVSPECVNRLSVENDEEAIGRMNRAHTKKPSTVICDALVFSTRASGHIKVPRCAKKMDDLNVVKRASIDKSVEKKDAYNRLFYCAYAMLAGVTINPRIEQAA